MTTDGEKPKTLVVTSPVLGQEKTAKPKTAKVVPTVGGKPVVAPRHKIQESRTAGKP